MQLLLSTTETAPDNLYITELRNRHLAKPVVDMDLLLSFDIDRIKRSLKLQEFLDDEYITLVTDLGQDVTNLQTDLEGPAGSGAGGTTNLVLVFANAVEKPLVGNNRDWGALAHFGFSGSSKWGAIAQIKAVAWGKVSGKTFDIRIIRHSDGETLCSKLDQTNTEPTVLTLSAPTNVPVDEDMLEVQMKTEAGGQYLLASLELLF